MGHTMNDEHKETTLGNIAPGIVFVTKTGVFAMKTAIQNQRTHYVCVRLGTGEVVYFPDGDKTPVRAVKIRRINWGLDMNLLDSVGHVHCFRCAMGRMGFTDEDFARVENKDAFIYNTLQGWQGDGLGGVYKDANTLATLPARCYSCEKPLVPCYPVVDEKFKARSDYREGM